MKIFWSWQSDTEGKTGRFLIRDALQDAIDKLKQEPDVEEPVREELHLDHDILGVPGSPDLARTIFAKVEASKVVVADVTAVGTTGSNKKLINSNVAIELGYALHARSDQNVLLVFNEYCGKYEDLPFDLRHRGGAIVFNLAPDAERKEIEEQRKSLQDQLMRKLRPFLDKKQRQPAVQHKEIPTGFSRAVYFGPREPLASSSGVHFFYPDQGLCYLRLIPKLALANQLELATLKDVALDAPLLRDGEYSRVFSGMNQFGAIKCTYEESRLTASTQLFQNGEIWCVSAWPIKTERDGVSQYVEVPSTSVYVLERTYYDTLREIIQFAREKLRLNPPWEVELGLAEVSGLYLYLKDSLMNGPLGPTYASVIAQRSSLDNTDDSILDPLLSFFSKVFDSVGERRPANLHGFPPNRPSLVRR